MSKIKSIDVFPVAVRVKSNVRLDQWLSAIRVFKMANADSA